MRILMTCLMLGMFTVAHPAFAEPIPSCERTWDTKVDAGLAGHLVAIEEALAIVIEEMKSKHQHIPGMKQNEPFTQKFTQRLAARMALVRKVPLPRYRDTAHLDAYFEGAKETADALELGMTEGFIYEAEKLIDELLPKLDGEADNKD